MLKDVLNAVDPGLFSECFTTFFERIRDAESEAKARARAIAQTWPRLVDANRYHISDEARRQRTPKLAWRRRGGYLNV